MVFDALDKMFNPKSVVIIGATDRPGSVGFSLVKNLINSRYEGKIHLINISGKKILGKKSKKSILEIKEIIDLVLIATPARTVPKIIDDCGLAGIKAVVIISAGFKEAGSEGDKLTERILDSAKHKGIRILGPNCLGLLNPALGLNASFSSKMPRKGSVAMISQSGAMVTSILDWSIEHNVGFSYFASIGSMIDVGFHDLIDYFGRDPDTSSILIYMESLTQARKFMSAARAFARNKPIIVLKVGKSSEGAKAALSHTGSLTGNDRVFDAAFRRAGIIRVNTIGELFDCAKALAMQKRPKGNRLAIITNAGGPGVTATDFLVSKGGALAEFSKKTVFALRQCLPKDVVVSNPLDILGDARPDRYKDVLRICLEDDDVDGVVVLLTPQFMTDPSLVAKNIVSDSKGVYKTVLTSFMGADDVKEAKLLLKKGSVPVYDMPEQAVQCFLNMFSYSRNLELLYQTPASIPHAFVPKTDENRIILQSVFDDKRTVMTEFEAKHFLKNYDIPVPESFVAKNTKDVEMIASKIGFPVVMKILSPDILHKTDVGGVVLDISSVKEAKDAYVRMVDLVVKSHPKARIFGVLVERMQSKRYELLIGSKKDDIFGPAILFGMGGVAVDLFNDTNVGLPPRNVALSKLLIEGTKIYQLLKGYRGIPGVDIGSIQFLLYKFSYLLNDFPEILEIDINPFAVDESGGVVLDAKIILDVSMMIDNDSVRKKKDDYSHLVISPYPKKYVKNIRLESGEELKFRPIRPEDEHLESELFRTFSDDTKRLRFFTPIEDMTHDMLVRYTQIDYDREIAIVAEHEINDKKTIRGVVRLVADAYNDSAEFAIVVGDPWQRKGLGSILADYIIDIAKSRRIRKIYAYFLKDNSAMKKIFERRNFKISERGSESYAELVLSRN